MARSRRKTPIVGGGPSAKWWKREANGVERAYARDRLAHEDWDAARAAKRRHSVEWDGPKECRFYHSPYESRCHCRWMSRRGTAWLYTCWYCACGGYRRWLERMMRK